MALLNVEGYYDPLLSFLDHAIDEGLCRPSVRELLIVGDDPTAVVERLLGEVAGR
jgi:predicted Rossmann-fold nucleotide-binding protein